MNNHSPHSVVGGMLRSSLPRCAPPSSSSSRRPCTMPASATANLPNRRPPLVDTVPIPTGGADSEGGRSSADGYTRQLHGVLLQLRRAGGRGGAAATASAADAGGGLRAGAACAGEWSRRGRRLSALLLQAWREGGRLARHRGKGIDVLLGREKIKWNGSRARFDVMVSTRKRDKGRGGALVFALQKKSGTCGWRAAERTGTALEGRPSLVGASCTPKINFGGWRTAQLQPAQQRGGLCTQATSSGKMGAKVVVVTRASNGNFTAGVIKTAAKAIESQFEPPEDAPQGHRSYGEGKSGLRNHPLHALPHLTAPTTAHISLRPHLDNPDMQLLLQVRLGREAEDPYQAHRKVHRRVRAVAPGRVEHSVQPLAHNLDASHGQETRWGRALSEWAGDEAAGSWETQDEAETTNTTVVPHAWAAAVVCGTKLTGTRERPPLCLSTDEKRHWPTRRRGKLES